MNAYISIEKNSNYNFVDCKILCFPCKGNYWKVHKQKFTQSFIVSNVISHNDWRNEIKPQTTIENTRQTDKHITDTQTRIEMYSEGISKD